MLAILLALGGWPVPAFACTLCHSPPAVAIRAGLFERDFWSTAAAVMLPIGMLLLVVVGVVREPKRRG